MTGMEGKRLAKSAAAALLPVMLIAAVTSVSSAATRAEVIDVVSVRGVITATRPPSACSISVRTTSARAAPS